MVVWLTRLWRRKAVMKNYRSETIQKGRDGLCKSTVMNNLTRRVKKLYWQEQGLGLLRFGGRKDKKKIILKTSLESQFFIWQAMQNHFYLLNKELKITLEKHYSSSCVHNELKLEEWTRRSANSNPNCYCHYTLKIKRKWWVPRY